MAKDKRTPRKATDLFERIVKASVTNVDKPKKKAAKKK